MITTIEPENDLVVIGIPTERVLLPEFVENRDAIMSRLGNRLLGISQMKGHRVDRNRDGIVEDFLSYPKKPDWLLFLDSDMMFPVDIAMRLMSARKPVIGGLYFHRSLHHPFFMTEYDEQPDKWGRMRRSWTFERQAVFDFLEKEAKLPMRDGAVAIDGILNKVRPCDAVGTGCMLIHRSVLEQMEPPWFEYRQMAESEDLTFCWRVKHELDTQTYIDIGSVCGHFNIIPQGQAQFRRAFKARGAVGARYDHTLASTWLEEFAGFEDGSKTLDEYNQEKLRQLWHDRPTDRDIDFYKSEDVGKEYLLDLLYWNNTASFHNIQDILIGMEDKKVVIIGAGAGTLACQLALQHCEVHAFEANAFLRDFAKKRWAWTKENRAHSPTGEIRWRGAFRRGTSFRSDMVDSVDLVVCIDTFEHMPEKDLIGVFDMLSVIMKRNGRVFFHNNFGQQDIYPMHHDHSAVWTSIIENAGFFQLDDLWLVKVYPMNTQPVASDNAINYEEIRYDF